MNTLVGVVHIIIIIIVAFCCHCHFQLCYFVAVVTITKVLEGLWVLLYLFVMFVCLLLLLFFGG